MSAIDCPYKTVKDLKKAINELPDEMWVCINGGGPVLEMIVEPHANEPFILLRGAP